MEQGEESLLRPCARALRLLGLWGPPARPFRACAVLLLNVAGALCAALALWAAPHRSLERLAADAYVGVTGVAMSVKSAAFLWHGSRLRRLARTLAAAGAAEAGGGARARYRRRAARIGRYIQAMALAPTVMWALDPLLVDAADAPGGRSLPLPVWLGDIDTSASPLYEAVYALQVLTIFVVIAAAMHVDVFFVVMMLAVAGELHALNDSVLAIRSPADPALPAAAEGPAGGARRPHQALVDVVRRHQLILACIGELEHVMSHSIFLLLFLNMVNICVHTFVTAVMLQQEVQPTTMYKMLLCIPIYMYETGVYCNFGQSITDQGEQLVTSAFSSGWPECGVRFRRVLLIFMLKASQPLQLTVANMYTLSRHTFLQLLNGSYTLFNMLYQVQGNK